MSSSHQTPAPTRQAVLISAAHQQRLRQGMAFERWAELLDSSYCEQVAVEQRSLPAPDLQAITTAHEWSRALRAWAQTVRRYEEGQLRFPAELEEAWVFALDGEYRRDCIRELAAREGCWGAERRPATPSGDADAYGSTVSRIGDLVKTAGQMLADGHFGPDDADQLDELRAHIERVRSDLAALERQAERGVSADNVVRVS